MNPLDQFSDAELQTELDRRVKIRRERSEAERKAREVKVVCPSCNGSRETVRENIEGISHWTCEKCHGAGWIMAQRRVT